jgi:protein HOOK3
VEFNDIVHFVSLPDFGQPNPNLAAEGQQDEIGRMLQLILGCAVNCDHKQQYIESIMNLEESVQQVLMLAIQEMITSGSTKGEGDHIMSVLEDSNREREELRQKCHELEIQVKLLTENKSIMTTELDNLQVQVKGKIEAES